MHIGRVGGRHAELDLAELGRKRIHIVGSSWSTRSGDDKRSIVARCRALTPEDFEAVRPRIHAVAPLASAAEAVDALALDEHVGKLVLVT